MSNSKLVDYTKLSPNCTKPRKAAIKKITIHHMAGNLSVESCGNLFANPARKASSNYGIGSDGRVGLYVDEANRAWCSGNADNDNQAVNIEVANDGGASTNWHVSDKALAKLIDLCADICIRNGINKLEYTGNKSGNLTIHSFFQATECCGAYLRSKLPYIVEEVNKKIGADATPSTPTAPVAPSNAFKPYLVKVTCDVLNVRSGAGKNYKVQTTVRKGEVYTIVDEKNGWGKLKSGAGWICLQYTKKI